MNSGFLKVKKRWLGSEKNPTNRYVHRSRLDGVNEGNSISMFNANFRPNVQATAQLPYDEVTVRDNDGAIIPF